MATQEQLQIVIDALYMAGDEFSKLQKDLEKSGKVTEKATKKTNKYAMALNAMAIGGLAMAGTAMAKFMKDSVLYAARVETLGVVTRQLGKNAGYTHGDIEGFEESVQELGITTEKSRESIALMMQSELDLSIATDLAREAQDAAVIAGIDSSEAFQRLVTVISTGSTRMARTMGIQVDFNQALEEMAEQLGVNKDELTSQQEVQARANAVLKEGSQIAGTYTAAMETAGKNLGSFTRHWKELMNSMGKRWQDQLGWGVKATTSVVDSLKDWADMAYELDYARQAGLATTKEKRWWLHKIRMGTMEVSDVMEILAERENEVADTSRRAAMATALQRQAMMELNETTDGVVGSTDAWKESMENAIEAAQNLKEEVLNVNEGFELTTALAASRASRIEKFSGMTTGTTIGMKGIYTPSEMQRLRMGETLEGGEGQDSMTIGAGDTLTSFAESFDTTVEKLMQVNPNIDDPNLIYAGEQLNVPLKNARDNIDAMNEGIQTITSGSHIVDVKFNFKQEGDVQGVTRQAADSMTEKFMERFGGLQ